MNLIPDISVLYQLIVFTVTFLVLNALVFKPALKLLSQREALTEGARHDAASFQKSAEEKIQSYTQNIETARQRGIAIRNDLKKAGEQRARELLQQAREELDQKLESSRQEIQRESASTQQLLRDTSQTLAQEIAEKILGRKVS